MIHKYRFKNFFSFAEETEVSFVLNRQVPVTNLVFESPGGARLSKILAAIGPNASGKTTVLKPLSLLEMVYCTFVYNYKPEKEIPVVSHFFSDVADSEFEIEFEVEWPTLSLFPGYQLQSGLYMKHCIKRQASSSALFSGVTGLRLTSTYNIRQQNFGFAAREAEKVRQNASLISTAAQYNVSCASWNWSIILQAFMPM